MVAEGGENRHNHHGKQPAGKAHVVEVHPILDFIRISGEGGKNKSDQYAGENPQGQAGMDTAQRHVTDQRRQRRGQQGHGGMLGKGFSLILGIEPCAQYNGPNIQYILPKQGEARHQPHLHHGKTVKGVFGQFNQADGEDHHQSGVYQRRTHAGYGDIIRNQQVLHRDNVIKPYGNISGIIQQNAQQNNNTRDGNGSWKDFLVAVLHAVSPSFMALWHPL